MDTGKTVKTARAATDERDPAYDYVAVVTRDRDGKPANSGKFKLLLPEGATDADKAAAWNLNGEMPPEDAIVYVKDWLRQ